MSTYRNGNRNARNIYRVAPGGEEHMAVAFDPADGPLIVEALNAMAETPTGAWCNGGPTLAGAICGRNDPHGPHNRCGRLDCDHWYCTPLAEEAASPCGALHHAGFTCKRPPHTPDSKHAAAGMGGLVQWW